MNKRITEAFANGKAFIPFLTCGDPSLEVTEQLVYAMEEAGADLIELGIPFSDPTAEGPVIQEANVWAYQQRKCGDYRKLCNNKCLYPHYSKRYRL